MKYQHPRGKASPHSQPCPNPHSGEGFRGSLAPQAAILKDGDSNQQGALEALCGLPTCGLTRSRAAREAVSENGRSILWKDALARGDPRTASGVVRKTRRFPSLQGVLCFLVCLFLNILAVERESLFCFSPPHMLYSFLSSTRFLLTQLTIVCFSHRNASCVCPQTVS